MFYCTGIDRDLCNVLIFDTDDNSTEFVSFEVFLKMHRQYGIIVENLDLDECLFNYSDNGKYISNLLNIFDNKMRLLITKLITLNKFDKENLTVESTKIAYMLGLVPYNSLTVVEMTFKYILLRSSNHYYNWG